MKTLKKFTVFLLPDDGGYQVLFPHYSGCITWGENVEEALENGREALELFLEVEAEQGGDPVPEYVSAAHVVVGEIEAEVPDSLIEMAEVAEQASR